MNIVFPNSNAPSAPKSDTNKKIPVANQENGRKGEVTSSKRSDLSDVVVELNRFMKTSNRAIEFSLDKSTGDTVVKVTDPSTGEVVRQIPSDEALSLAHRLHQQNSPSGMIIEAKV
jgi:flagellar protein FlaG